MEILFILIPVSLLIVAVSLAAFVWSVYNNQYDDLEKEAERILFDDPVIAGTTSTKTTNLESGRAGGKEESS